jgi:capsular exopolysaccharide synthesis family protein
MLEVKPVPRTRLVKVAVSTPAPELSTQVVNAHVKAYIQQGVNLRIQANEEAQGFLEEKLVELKERVEKSEAALNSYRRDKGILSLDDKENIIVDRLSDLNKLLTAAEADKISSEAQLHLIRKRAYDSLPEIISNPLIQSLKGQQTTLQGEYAQLADRFKPDYPRLSQLRAQLAEIQQRLSREMQKVAASLESTYQAAETREKGLRAKMEEQKAATLKLKDDSVNYAILAREVDTNRQLYDSVLQRMKEMGVAAEVRTSNVSIIDPGEPPLRPSRPRKLLSLLLSSVVGLMGGIGLAFFLEYLDNSLRNPEEAERYLGLPNLAVVPDFLRANRHGDPEPKAFLSVVQEAARRISGKLAQEQLPTPDQELVIFHHPFSVVTEAYRTLRTAILLSRAGEAPRTVLFTSAAAGEGKTVTTVNLATIFAQMDLRVLVIDADLRRPRCHQVLRAPNGAGLTELLTGQREVSEIIKPTATENLFLLSSGAVPPNPAELIGSRKMHDTLKILQGDYDCVFIDSPPVMPVSDTLLLSTAVDGVVLVINGQGTPRQLVREAQSRLTYARAKILGVVLNRVNMQAGDYPYYYYHYASYYHHTNGKEDG